MQGLVSLLICLCLGGMVMSFLAILTPRPQWKLPTRKRAFLSLAGFFALTLIASALMPEPTAEELASRKAKAQAEAQAEAQAREKAEAQAKAKAQEQAEREKILEAEREAQRKRDAIVQAREDRKNRIKKGFSAWDGSHRSLTRIIQNRLMNDPDSYEHDETRYIDKEDHLIVITRFRGRNAFGGMVRHTVTAKVDLDGSVLEILSAQ